MPHKYGNISLRKIISQWHIIIPLLIIPLLFVKSLIDPVLILRYTVFAAYLLGFSLLLFRAKNRNYLYQHRLKQPLIIVYLIYVLSGFISLIYSSNFIDGLYESLKISLPFIFLILLLLSVHDERDMAKRTFCLITLFGFVILVIGLYQLYQLLHTQGISHESMYEVSSVFAHKNIFAEVLLLCLPFFISAIIFCKRTWKILGIIVSLLALFFITVLLSRAVWLAAAVSILFGLVFFLIFVLPRKKINRKFRISVLAGFILIVSVVVVSVLFYARKDGIDTFTKQIEKIGNFNYGSTKDRIALWEKTGEVIKEAPLKGHGAGSWKIEVLKYGNSNLRSQDLVTFYQRPHNDFLWIWSETGILALIAYILIFVFAILRTIKLARNSDLLMGTFYTLIFMLFVGYLVFSVFSFPKERVEHGIFLSIALFFILSGSEKNIIEKKLSFYRTLPIWVSLIFVSFVATVIGGYRIKSEVHLEKAYQARNISNWTQVIKEINKAESMFYQLDPFTTPLLWYRAGAYFNLGMIDKAIVDYEKSWKINPYHIYILNDYASCLQLNSKSAEAIVLYKKALHIAPDYQEALFNLTAVYFNLDSIPQAYATFIQIDTSIASERYIQYQNVITDNIAAELQGFVSENELKMQIQEIKNNKEWMSQIFEISVNEKNDFRNRLLEEAIYSLCKIDAKISKQEADKLRIKYNID